MSFYQVMIPDLLYTLMLFEFIKYLKSSSKRMIKVIKEFISLFKIINKKRKANPNIYL